MIHILKTWLAIIAVACAATASAQPYPNRPLRIILPFAAGSTTDVIARIVGQKLSERVGQQVVIEARPGANGMVGSEAVAKSAPDGYTLLLASNGTHGINASMFSRLPYDPVKDFEPVIQVGVVSYILVVRNDLPARNLTELVALAKSRPGTISFGSTGSVVELGGTLLGLTTGVQFNRVPYKAPAQALVDLMGNRLDALMEPAATLVQHIQAGSIRPIAVSSRQRSVLLPAVPSIAESGYPEFEVTAWLAIMAPAGTPPATVARLNTELTRILNMQDVRDAMLQKGVEAAPTTPAKLGENVRTEVAKWSRLFRDANIPKIN